LRASSAVPTFAPVVQNLQASEVFVFQKAQRLPT